MNTKEFAWQRKHLVELMIATGSISNPAIKKAFLAVPREKFFPKNMLSHAYEDSAFPIGCGQTISQPSTIAVMLEMLALRQGQKILEVGSGSGYVTALLAEIVGKKGRVFGLELLHELHQRAVRTLLELGYENVQLRCGNGTHGWKEEAPFDRIIISAACKNVPTTLIEQLAENGNLVAPLGDKFSQELVLLQKENGKIIEKERRGYFVFVPLLENKDCC